MKCVACQRVIADGSKFCPYCGNVQPETGGDSGVVAGIVPPAYAPTVAPPSGTPRPGANVLPPAPPAGGAPRPGGAGGPASSRATMAMIAGIGSIVVSLGSCCACGLPSLLSIPAGIYAFVSGRNELEDIAGGFASAAGQGPANTGKITGIIGIISGVIGAIVGVIIALASSANPH